MRRRPVQQRSLERVARLLDASAQVLEEVGYDALTTREVARRAGVPIGTLYQFFEGKQELCRALAERNLEEFVRRLAAGFAEQPPRRWSDTAPIVVAEYVAMKRTVPGFGVIDFGDARAGRPYLLDPADGLPNNAMVARRLAEFGVGELGLPSRADGELERVLWVAAEVVDVVVRLAFTTAADGDPGLIAEAESLLHGYLSTRLDLVGS